DWQLWNWQGPATQDQLEWTAAGRQSLPPAAPVWTAGSGGGMLASLPAAAGAAVVHVGLGVGLVRELPVAVGVDAAGIGGRGGADRAHALDGAADAGL